MDILVTGHVGLINEEFFRKLNKKNKVVVCGNEECLVEEGQVIPYHFRTDSAEFEKLFSTYTFKYVIYISYCMEERAYEELECLERVLELSRKREETVFIYLNPSDAVMVQQSEADAVISDAASRLCGLHKEMGYSLLDLKIPYLVGENGNTGNLSNVLKRAYKEKKLCFATEPSQNTDVLFEEDLSELLNRFIEEGENGYFSFVISGKNERSVQQLAEELKKAGLDFEVQYGTKPTVLLQDTEVVRERYGWFPVKNLDSFLTGWIKEMKKNPVKKKEKNAPQKSTVSKLITLAEFLLMYVVCEILTRKTSGISLINYVDFRMFFVVISGMMYGLRYGITAAVLSCLTYFVSGDMNGNWQIQFYNIVNWLPFAIYLLSGAIAGYTKDTYKAQLKTGQEEQKILENKYVYLNELYMNTLENKEQYSAQITNYVNSFGRIYDVTKQLNSVLPGEIYNVAINVMEDMLENRNVAIYAVDHNSSFARLSVCSKNLNEELGKSLDLKKNEKLLKVLQNNETWVNRERLEGYPDYAYPIFKDGEITGIIMILHVDYRQMNMDYLNRFQIMAGLISDSLMRAREYQELVERDILLENTRIWKAEAFAQEVEMQRQMKENNRADYVLLKIISNETDYVVLDRKLQKCIRQRDRIGLGKDNRLYMLLTQADEKSVGIVKERLKGMDIQLEIA